MTIFREYPLTDVLHRPVCHIDFPETLVIKALPYHVDLNSTGEPVEGTRRRKPFGFLEPFDGSALSAPEDDVLVPPPIEMAHFVVE